MSGAGYTLSGRLPGRPDALARRVEGLAAPRPAAGDRLPAVAGLGSGGATVDNEDGSLFCCLTKENTIAHSHTTAPPHPYTILRPPGQTPETAVAGLQGRSC